MCALTRLGKKVMKPLIFSKSCAGPRQSRVIHLIQGLAVKMWKIYSIEPIMMFSVLHWDDFSFLLLTKQGAVYHICKYDQDLYAMTRKVAIQIPVKPIGTKRKKNVGCQITFINEWSQILSGYANLQLQWDSNIMSHLQSKVEILPQSGHASAQEVWSLLLVTWSCPQIRIHSFYQNVELV